MQVLMASIALRRTKGLQLNGRPLVVLPTKTLHLVTVRLDADSQHKYDRWQAAGESWLVRACVQGRLGGGGLVRGPRQPLNCLSPVLLQSLTYVSSIATLLGPALLLTPDCLQGAPSLSDTWPTTHCCRTTQLCWRSCCACAR